MVMDKAVFNSTGIPTGNGTPPTNRRVTFHLRKGPRSHAIDKSAVLTDLILSNKMVEKAVSTLPNSTPVDSTSGPDVLSILIDRYTNAIDSVKAENKSLKEMITDTTPLPSTEEALFNTGPQRLAVAIDKLIEEFGPEEHDAVPPQQETSTLDTVDDLLHLTSAVVQTAQIAGNIQRWCAPTDSETQIHK